MKRFVIVLRYELKEYFSSKVFMVLTAMLAVLGAMLLFLPRFVDMSDFTGVQIVGGDSGEETSKEEGEQTAYIYLDQAGVVQPEILGQMFPESSWSEAADEAEVRAAVEAQEAEAG